MDKKEKVVIEKKADEIAFSKSDNEAFKNALIYGVLLVPAILFILWILKEAGLHAIAEYFLIACIIALVIGAAIEGDKPSAGRNNNDIGKKRDDSKNNLNNGTTAVLLGYSALSGGTSGS